ncbi:hypothetical protein METHP14_990002 [Pseudomonas sp. P14-2025]
MPEIITIRLSVRLSRYISWVTGAQNRIYSSLRLAIPDQFPSENTSSLRRFKCDSGSL